MYINIVFFFFFVKHFQLKVLTLLLVMIRCVLLQSDLHYFSIISLKLILPLEYFLSIITYRYIKSFNIMIRNI